jgi:hypothetical protein
MLRNKYSDLFISRLAYLDEIIHENFDPPSLKYTMWANVRDSKRGYEEVTGLTGFGTFDEVNEAGPVTYDTLLQMYDKRFTHIGFAKGYQISRWAMDDDLDGALSNAAPALANAARVSIDRYFHGILNLGFAAATMATPDGVALFSGDHLTVSGGGTTDNLVTGDISIANLETALNLFANMTNDRGLEIDVEPEILLVHPDLRWLVHEILRSELRSDTANNASNAFNQIGINVVLDRYITDAEDWFVMTNPQKHRLLAYWRQDPIVDHNLDFATGNMQTKMTYRCVRGAADWRGVVGGNGS